VDGKVRWETTCLLANLGLLSVVVSSFHFGLGAHRIRTAAIFLILGTGWSLYGELLFHACKLRARRQRERPVPHDVRLRMPLWIEAGGLITLLSMSAPVAALAAGLGSGQAGFGVLLAVAALTATVGDLVARYSFRSLAFETSGLRLYLAGGSNLLVPWKSIASVDIEGQAEWKLVQLTLFETRSALASFAPNMPRARQRATLALHGDDGSPGRILLTQWAAGIDAPVLASAIKAEMAGSGTERFN
jgi:hypothetical protein